MKWKAVCANFILLLAKFVIRQDKIDIAAKQFKLFLKNSFKTLFIFMLHVRACCLHICLCTTVSYARGGQRGPDRRSETGVTDPCELGTEPSPLQEQQVILITNHQTPRGIRSSV